MTITTTSLGWALYAEAKLAGMESGMRAATTARRIHSDTAMERGKNLIAQLVYTGGRVGESRDSRASLDRTAEGGCSHMSISVVS